jgi:hypothetical protein
MTKKLLAITLGALIGLSPLAAIAQSDAPAQPMQVAQAASGAATSATPRGSHNRQMRARGNLSRERARAAAEHKRMMRHTGTN